MPVNSTKIRPLSLIKSCVVPSGQRSVKIPFGVFRGLTLRIDFKSQTQLYLGLWEFETHRWIRDALGHARWMIDVGAGYGELCILFRRNLCRAIAIEPDMTSLSVMRSNMALNGLSGSDVEIFPKYVGSSIDREYVKLDDIQVDRSQPGFIKIDIEGFEAEALESGTALIAESDAKLLIEVHSHELETGCLSFLNDHGYRCTIIDNSRWRLLIPERRPAVHNRWIWAESTSPTRGRNSRMSGTYA